MLKKLIYRSTYRGSREMDYLLSRFAKHKLESLSQEEIQTYSKFLDMEDPDIYDWIMSKKPVPQQFIKIVDKIKENASY